MTPEKIRKAPSAKALNAMLPDYAAVVSSAPRLWTVQIDGEAKGFPEPFTDARERMATLFEA